ncbi:MAG: crotonobetainyl-CoA--carnitine CoA-transferase [Nitrospira sp.]|nr:MAG: crotonobetainyl-CoA--carnitine CoA-transferase [Nitrospira sp.]
MEPLSSEQEVRAYKRLVELHHQSPVPPKESLANLGLFLNRASMSRILFMHNLYAKIVHTHGIVVEFGVRWGQNLALFSTFRTMYEPHNFSRKIVGFDTFEGFPSIATQDGTDQGCQVGALSVTRNYESYLEDLLTTHEQLAPRAHLKKFELVKGDVQNTLSVYLDSHPETIIALAYFDMDLYEPTKFCLEKIKGHLTKGSVIGFDELMLAELPGETVALKELWGLSKYRICRDPISNYQSYFIVE